MTDYISASVKERGSVSTFSVSSGSSSVVSEERFVNALIAFREEEREAKLLLETTWIIRNLKWWPTMYETNEAYLELKATVATGQIGIFCTS